MGVIKKQSIFSTIVSYTGVIIGFISSAVIMPIVFMPSQVGFIKLIFALLGLFSGIFSLGVFQMLYRFYPRFSDDLIKQNYLFYYAIRLSIIGGIIALPFYLLSVSNLLNLDDLTNGIEKSSLLIVSVFIAVLARLIYNGFSGYIKMMGDIMIDAILQNIVLKGGMLVLITLFYFNIISFSVYVYILLGIYVLFPIFILFYMKLKFEIPRMNRSVKLNKLEFKELLKLTTFGTLSTLGGTIYLYLDTLMVNEYLGETEVGVYGTMFLFGIIINVPARGLKSVSQSVISHAIEENNIDNVHDVYRKSSASLLAVGGLIFLIVWCNLYSVYAYLPHEYGGSSLVVLFIGIAQLVDMSFGVNSEIINGSPFYKLNTYFIFISIVIAIVANILFIPKFGVSGAAFATLLAFISVNIVRTIAIYKYYKIQPFTAKTIYSIALIVAIALILEYIPNFENYIFNLFWKGGLVICLYLPIVYLIRLSVDINSIIDNFFKRIFKK